MKNINLASNLFHIFKKMQMTDLVVCAGARNAPLLSALENTDFLIESYFEERSSGFYALGKSKNANRPVAIITTSGTAAAELLPAVIEAHYQNIPLIVITADRPKSYRGTGSPQAIEQVGIFGSYVESTADWDVHTVDFSIHFSGHKPIHINICFDEPLSTDQMLPVPSISAQIVNQQKTNISDQKIIIRNPIAIISELQKNDRVFIKNFLLKNQIVHYAEFLSGLRNDPELLPLQILNSEQTLKKIFTEQKSESIVRMGGIPTLRFWRDLEFGFNHIHVYSFSHTEFSGLCRRNELYAFRQLQGVEIIKTSVFDLISDQDIQSQKLKLISELKNSEQNYIFQLSEIIGNQSLYVGNSLPIRMWDAFTTQPQFMQSVYANRGANGIDGQISTYLGWSEKMIESWCLIGDLTALYDLASLGLSNFSECKRRIVVMNNSGGQIFNRLFGNKKYLNSQKVDFKSWAGLWHWDYIEISDSADFNKLEFIKSDHIIIELKPDNAQTELFWQKWDTICKK